MCSNLIAKTPERRQWRHSGVLIVNFDCISHLYVVFLLDTLSQNEYAMGCKGCIDFQHFKYTAIRM